MYLLVLLRPVILIEYVFTGSFNFLIKVDLCLLVLLSKNWGLYYHGYVLWYDGQCSEREGLLTTDGDEEDREWGKNKNHEGTS